MSDTIDPDGVTLQVIFKHFCPRITKQVFISAIILLKLQFEMLKHTFPFGTALKAKLMSDTSGKYQAYQDFFFNNFNFAVLENALKWVKMEPNQV